MIASTFHKTLEIQGVLPAFLFVILVTHVDVSGVDNTLWNPTRLQFSLAGGSASLVDTSFNNIVSTHSL